MFDEVLTAIATVGFPIVAYLLNYFYLAKIIVKNTEAITALTIELGKQRHG